MPSKKWIAEYQKSFCVFCKKFGGSSINLLLHFRFLLPRIPKVQDNQKVVSDPVIHVKRAFDQEGLTIPWPIRSIDFGGKGCEKFHQMIDGSQIHVRNAE